ncbi:MAG: DUF1295 domain-containing protein [Pseudomonadales bacterium]|nr:DUF1295 domain-containing protein [Pseudomonadales bacterium]
MAPEFILILLIFAIQWLAFIPASYFKTERFYDLVGGLTYTVAILIALLYSHNGHWRSGLLGLMVIVWSLRLGVFLFLRIRTAGGDSRFEKIKISPVRFFIAWSLQGVWITFTASAAILAITSTEVAYFGFVSVLGLTLWIVGFSIEVIADQQKLRFRKEPSNANQFISSGLWSFCRHPNYTGEIMLWLGIALIAYPVLDAWHQLSLLSPVFVALLLTRGSGIPILERAAEAKWGETEAYKHYKASTPRLFPGY